MLWVYSMYANKRQIALNTPEQPGGISPPLTPLEALNKPRWTQTALCGSTP